MRYDMDMADAVSDEWIDEHPADVAQVVPPGGARLDDPIGRLGVLLGRWATVFAEKRFGEPQPLRLGSRGVHADEAAAFLRALDAGAVIVRADGGFTMSACRQKTTGGSYNLFTENRWNDDFYVGLNTEYLIHIGAAAALTSWGWRAEEIDFEVGEFDARAWSGDRVALLMEAKARVEGADGLATLLRSFVEWGNAGIVPEPDSNHSRKFVELWRSAESGPVLLWLVAAGARWAFTAERANGSVALSERPDPAPGGVGATSSLPMDTTINRRQEDAAMAVSEVEEQIAEAVRQALLLAPAVAEAKAHDRTERGIDVAFEDEPSARLAQQAVKEALDGGGWADDVAVWLWRPSSTGAPLTAAGEATGRELRLNPKISER